VRASALVAVAKTQDPRDLDIFREALVHLDPGVRYGAIQALTVWGQPQFAQPLLLAASERDYEPILKVAAAAGLAKLGDTQGLHRLRAFLDDPSWLVRAMAARYLGEYGQAEDYDLLVSRIGREQSNDFTVAEVCIAALKLFPKKP
jgi:HEAT repeat protein